MVKDALHAALAIVSLLAVTYSGGCGGLGPSARAHLDASTNDSADDRPADYGSVDNGLDRGDSANDRPADYGSVDNGLDRGDSADERLERADSTDDCPNQTASLDGVDAGGEGGTSITVTGTVIDTFRQPIAGWQVELGGAATSTDSNGKFTFTNVTPPYDVAFTSPGIPGTTVIPELWIYQGLTRSDPTLQPMRTAGLNRMDLAIDRINVPAPTTADGGSIPVTLGIGIGTPEFAGSDNTSLMTSWSATLSWFGTTSLVGTIHGLAWTQPSGSEESVRGNKYLSYTEAPLAMAANSDPSSQRVTLDFTPNEVPTADFQVSIQASWDGPPSVIRSLHSVVVFDSNATLWVGSVRDIIQDASATTALAPTMPLLPGSHVVFLAMQDTGQGTSFGLVHRLAKANGDSVVLDIPEPRKLIAPQKGSSGIDTSTTFVWSEGSSVSVFSVRCPDARIGINVVTLKTATRLQPLLPALKMSLPTGADCSWHIDVHGSYVSVDDASGADGMLDPCQYYDNCERANLLGDGSLTVSEWRAFKTAP